MQVDLSLSPVDYLFHLWEWDKITEQPCSALSDRKNKVLGTAEGYIIPQSRDCRERNRRKNQADVQYGKGAESGELRKFSDQRIDSNYRHQKFKTRRKFSAISTNSLAQIPDSRRL